MLHLGDLTLAHLAYTPLRRFTLMPAAERVTFRILVDAVSSTVYAACHQRPILCVLRMDGSTGSTATYSVDEPAFSFAFAERRSPLSPMPLFLAHPRSISRYSAEPLLVSQSARTDDDLELRLDTIAGYIRRAVEAEARLHFVPPDFVLMRDLDGAAGGAA